MKISKLCITIGACIWMALTVAGTSVAATTDQYGGQYDYWPDEGDWMAITSLNDPDDGALERLDFVGDATDPAAYIAWDDNYLYFRQRVDFGGPVDSDTYADATFIAFDSTDANTSPEWAVTWDTKGLKSQPGEHGLEFLYLHTGGASWSATKFQDLDGHPQTKDIPPDFNTNGNGYLRTIDGVSTTNFGTTTYIDYALSWDYLYDATTYGRDELGLTYPLLEPGTTWYVQFGSVEDNTDHAFVAEDVAGNRNPADSGLSYSDPIQLGDGPATVPEPSTAAALIILGALKYALRKRR